MSSLLSQSLMLQDQCENGVSTSECLLITDYSHPDWSVLLRLAIRESLRGAVRILLVYFLVLSAHICPDKCWVSLHRTGRHDMYTSLRWAEMVVAYPGQSRKVAVRIQRIAGFGIRKVGKSWNLQRDVERHARTAIYSAWKEGKCRRRKDSHTAHWFKGDVAHICARFSPVEQHDATE
jgi:hypothetical protein